MRAGMLRLVCASVLAGGTGAACVTRPPASLPAFLGRVGVDTLPPAISRRDKPGEVVIEFPPADVPAAHHEHEGMTRLPVHRVDVPVSGSFHRFRVELVDSAGRLLPADRLHHLILFDPDHRELFAPIVMRVLAAGRETGGVALPKLLFGMPLWRGQRLILSGMISNPDETPMRGVRLRLVLGYVSARRPWPVHRVYPWTMDVAWPLGGAGGSKAFDVPPGRSVRAWEGSPAIGGFILGIGGHVHDHAVRLEFRDVTRGVVLWEGKPVVDSTGRVAALARGFFYRWYRLGLRVVPHHRYRITVEYENPTSATLPDGGMGSISGLIVPADRWPRVDPVDTLYRRDLYNVLRNMEGAMGAMSGMR